MDLKEDEVTLLEDLQNKEEYERVRVQAKVLEVMDPTTVANGKKVQDVTVADSTDCVRCTLWEADIGQLEKGKSYDMKMFLIREFNSKNYLSKAKDSEIVEFDDIGETVSYSAELQDHSTTILSAEIVGVAELEKHKTCLRCKGRVEPLDLGLGRCAKEGCQMLQKYAVCPEHLFATLMFMTAPGVVSLHTYGQTLLEIARVQDGDGQVTEDSLMKLPAFVSVTYNSQNVITGFVPDSTSV